MTEPLGSLADVAFSDAQREALEQILGTLKNSASVLAFALESISYHSANGECVGTEILTVARDLKHISNAISLLLDACCGRKTQLVELRGQPLH